ncbi:hypothetical protein GCM10010388_09140 [Streptomyces mauvecolor]
MKAIQALLGHASFSLTADTYTSLMPKFAKAEAEATAAVVPRRRAPETPSDPDAEPTPATPREPRFTLVPANASSSRLAA